MKKALFTFAMVAALLAGTSCSKESLNEVSEINNVEEGVVLPDEIEVSYDESMITKSFFGTDLKTPQWDETDSFFLKGSQPTIWYKFERYPDASNKTKAMFKKATYGSFPGTMPTQIQAIYGLKEGTKPGTCTLPGTWNYQGRAGLETRKISNLPMQAEIDASSGTMDMSLKFYPVANILAVKLKEGEMVKRIRISADDMPFSGQVTTALNGSGSNRYGTMTMDDNTSTAGYEIVCKGVGMQSNDHVFYFPIPSKSGTANKVQVNNLKVEVFGIKEQSVKVMIAKNDIVLKKDDATNKSVIYRVDFEENAVKLYGTTYWATKNVGATSKTDPGYYFVWGNVAPGASPANYLTASVDFAGKWFKDQAGANKTVDKSKANYGDPVKYQIGEAWQTPSKADFQALLDSCDWAWDATNKGFKVTSKNLTPKTEIFLPAGGYIDDEGYKNEEGNYCHYWSSTPNTTLDAYFLCVKTSSGLDKEVAHNPRTYSKNLRGLIHTGVKPN